MTTTAELEPEVDRGSRLRLPTVSVAAGIGIVVMPNLAISRLGEYDGQRLVQVVVMALIALWLCADGDARRSVGAIMSGAGRMWTVIAAVTAVGLLSGLTAADPATALLDVSLLCGSALLGLAVAGEVRSHGWVALRVLGLSVVVSVVAQLSVIAYVRVLPEDVTLLWSQGGFFGGFSHPRFLNQFQAMTLPIVAVAATSPRPWLAWTARFAVLAGVWSLTMTTGRGAGLALVTALLLVAATHGRDGRRWAVALGVPLLLGAVLGIAALAWTPPSEVATTSVARDLTGTTGRVTIWRTTADLALEQPLLGVGPGHLAHADVVDAYREGVPAHPHSSVLQLAAEWGLPATLAVATLVVAGALTLLRRPTRPTLPRATIDTGVLTAGVTAAFGAGLVLSLVSGVIVTPVGLTLLATSGGVAAGLRSLADDTSPTAPAPSAALGLAAALALVATVAVMAVETTTTPVATRAAATEAYIADAPEGTTLLLRPRFWQQGMRGVTP